VRFEHGTAHISAMSNAEHIKTLMSSKLIDLQGSNLMKIVSLDAQCIPEIAKKIEYLVISIFFT
jgi:hypothetical protein